MSKEATGSKTRPCVSEIKLPDLEEGVFAGRQPRDELRILLRPGAHAAVRAHAKSSTEAEVCGVLLGKASKDAQGPFLIVEDVIEGQAAQSAPARVTFTPESWEHIFKEQEQRDPSLKMVGWYHTHPRFGIFLSNYDQFIHENFFAVEPWMVAYVVDPVRDEEGFFCWSQGKTKRVPRYWIGDAPRVSDGAEFEGREVADDAAPPPVVQVTPEKPLAAAAPLLAASPSALPEEAPWHRDPLALGLVGALCVGMFVYLGWTMFFPDRSDLMIQRELLQVKIYQGALNAELRDLRRELRLPPSKSPELEQLDRVFQATLEELRKQAERDLDQRNGLGGRRSPPGGAPGGAPPKPSDGASPPKTPPSTDSASTPPKAPSEGATQAPGPEAQDPKAPGPEAPGPEASGPEASSPEASSSGPEAPAPGEAATPPAEEPAGPPAPGTQGD
jgi:proteasome lid subunit RPN8/RPN11